MTMIQAAVWMRDLADSTVLGFLVFASAMIVIAGAIMLTQRRRGFRRTEIEPIRDGADERQGIEGFSGRRVSETDGGKLYAIVGERDTCPDCGQRGFYAGPEGGMSTNIYCVNWRCKSAFNITPFGVGNGTCERIGKAPSYVFYPEEPTGATPLTPS